MRSLWLVPRGEGALSKTLAIIQARQTSSRLPGKALADVRGKPLVERVVDRVKLARNLDGIVLAVPDTPKNDALWEFAHVEMGWVCFPGPEDDVLGRYVTAAKLYDADPIVRVTADCPFLDPGVIDGVVNLFRRGECDYAANNLARSVPSRPGR